MMGSHAHHDESMSMSNIEVEAKWNFICKPLQWVHHEFSELTDLTPASKTETIPVTRALLLISWYKNIIEGFWFVNALTTKALS